MDGEDRAPENAKRRRAHRRIVWIPLVSVLVAITVILFRLEYAPECAALLAPGEAPMLLPANCRERARPAADEWKKYFDSERNKRGLKHQAWISCASISDAQAWVKTIDGDGRWLPSYVPGTYQWRRIVILLPYGTRGSAGSDVIAEVCSVPWTRYIRQISGECNGKFSVWK